MSQEIEKWLKTNTEHVTVYQVVGLFGRAYVKAAMIESAVKGFQKAELFPLNKNISGPSDFVIFDRGGSVSVVATPPHPVVEDQGRSRDTIESSPTN